MFRRNHSARERLTLTQVWRACPVLVSLEDRESPSSFPGSGYLILPAEVYLPAFPEVRTNVESQAVLASRAATPDGSTPITGVDSTPERALGTRLIPDVADSGPMNRAGPATSAPSSFDRSGSQGFQPPPTDRADEVFSGAGTNQRLRRVRSKEPAPKITEFHVSQNDDGTWTITGHVKSHFAPLLTIRFGSDPDGSVPSVDGQGTGVDGQGNFQFSTQLQPCEHGMVTAQTSSDPNGRASKTAEDYVSQTGCGNQPGK